MIDVTLEAPIPPKGKGRPRFNRTTGTAYTPAATRNWEATLAMMAKSVMPSEVIDEPLRVDILAVVARPKRLMRKSDPDGLIWAPSRPDCDNYIKAILDSLHTFWRDDAIVVDCSILKAYAERSGRARVVVRIRSVGDVNTLAGITFYGASAPKKEKKDG